MSKLTRIEQETIVVFNVQERQASVYTCNRSLMKKLRAFSEKFPDMAILQHEDTESVTYLVPKS